MGSERSSFSERFRARFSWTELGVQSIGAGVASVLVYLCAWSVSPHPVNRAADVAALLAVVVVALPAFGRITGITGPRRHRRPGEPLAPVRDRRRVRLLAAAWALVAAANLGLAVVQIHAGRTGAWVFPLAAAEFLALSARRVHELAELRRGASRAGRRVRTRSVRTRVHG